MTTSQPTIAAITNVVICTRLVERLMDRTMHLPGLGVFYGHAGLGKSMAAAYAANRSRAYYVECKSTWHNKDFLTAIAREIGITAGKTTNAIMNQVAEELTLSQRPLIIDEVDYIVAKKMVDTVRDLYEMSQAPILMIGEETVLDKMAKWPRFHGRVLAHERAMPATFDDVRALASLYAPGIEISDDLLAAMQKECGGNARYISVNLDAFRQHCGKKGLPRLAANDWNYGFFTGARRVRAGQ